MKRRIKLGFACGIGILGLIGSIALGTSWKQEEMEGAVSMETEVSTEKVILSETNVSAEKVTSKETNVSAEKVTSKETNVSTKEVTSGETNVSAEKVASGETNVFAEKVASVQAEISTEVMSSTEDVSSPEAPAEMGTTEDDKSTDAGQTDSEKVIAEKDADEEQEDTPVPDAVTTFQPVADTTVDDAEETVYPIMLSAIEDTSWYSNDQGQIFLEQNGVLASAPEDKYVDTQLVVKAAALSEEELAHCTARVGDFCVLEYENAEEAAEAKEKYEQQKTVEEVEYVQKVTICDTGADDYEYLSYGPEQIKSDVFVDRILEEKGGIETLPEVVVAVIDTGERVIIMSS